MKQMRIEPVFAHCDIPCRIYDPVCAQIAGLTVVRLLSLMANISASKKISVENKHEISRLTAEKEEQASLVKSEIATIWGDYFKKNHLEQHPEIHDVSHSIMAKASACKQSLTIDHGLELVELLNDFAEIFWSSKSINCERVMCPYPPELAIVRPLLAKA